MEENSKKENRIWKLVPYPGRPVSYTPEALWEKFDLYMEHNKSITWAKDDFIKSGPGAGTIVTLDIPNPPSISEDTFRDYGKKNEEYRAVCSPIRDIIQTIQISGAATNTFNANIVARWAGLIDKKELEIKSELSDDERSDMIRSMLEKIKKD
jgi:hypothetical protein